MPQETEDKAPIGYVYDFAAQLGNETTFTIRGNFDKGASKEAMNAELDKLRLVVTRQQSISMIGAFEDRVTKQKRLIENLSTDLAKLDTANEGKRLSTQDEAARFNMENTLRGYQGQLQDLETNLESIKKEAA